MSRLRATLDLRHGWWEDGALVRPVAAGLLYAVAESLFSLGPTLGMGGADALVRLIGLSVVGGVALCTALWAAGSLFLRLSGAAEGGAEVPWVAERAALLASAGGALVMALAAWFLTQGPSVSAILIRVPVVLFSAASVAVALHLLVRAAVVRANFAMPRRRRRLALAIFVAAAVALCLDALFLRRLYPAFHALFSASALTLTLLAVAVWPFANVRRVVARSTLLLGLFAVATFPYAMQLALGAPSTLALVEAAAPTTGQVLRLYRRLSTGPERRRDGDPRAPMMERVGPTHGSIDLHDVDLLIITVDALRADCVGVVGEQSLTPEIDALAGGAAVFRRAYTPTPNTSYALTSLFSGTFAREAFAIEAPPQVDAMVPALLSRRGYQTAAFYPPSIFSVDGARFPVMSATGFGFEHRNVGHATGAARVEQLSAFLRGASSEAPVFAWVHLYEPHEPYRAPSIPDDAPARERYDRAVRLADRAVGALVRAFREQRPGATVIVGADHGEEFGDHGGSYHGTTVYEEQVHIPLIWSSPGAVEPSVLDVPVELTDVATTLLSTLGLPRPMSMHGDDLTAALAGVPDAGPRYAFASVGDQRMVTDGRFKAICVRGVDGCRLFDLSRDPAERHDLAEERPAHEHRLRGASEAILQSIAASGRGDTGDRIRRVLDRARLGDPTVVSSLVSVLSSEDAQSRAMAAQFLGELGHGPALPTLTRLALLDPSTTVRAEAAMAALALEGEGAEALIRELGRFSPGQLPAPQARRVALALADAGNATGAPILLELAADTSASRPMRGRAIRSLGRLQESRAVTLLISLLSDLYLRIDAADALGRLGDASAADALAAAFGEEPYPQARLADLRALAALGDPRLRRLLKRELSAADRASGVLGLFMRDGGLDRAHGADLIRGPHRLAGSWHCSPAGCTPSGPDAAVPARGRARQGEGQLVLRLLSAGAPSSISSAGRRWQIDEGVSELAIPVDAAGGAVPLEAEGPLWVEAFAFVDSPASAAQVAP